MNVTYIDRYIIDGQKSQLSLNKFYDSMLCTNMPIADNDDTIKDLFRIPVYDMFLRYRSQLEDSVVMRYIDNKYFYKPKTISLSLYGTTEMWTSILRLNKMRNVSEFTKNYIKVYDPDRVVELLQIFLKREEKI